MGIDVRSSNGWFWSSDTEPPSDRWIETGRAGHAPSGRLRHHEAPAGFWKGPPSVNVLFHRTEEPTAASPLTYVEYGYLLPNATEDEAAEFLLTQLVLVQDELQAAGEGQLIHLAVCDAATAHRSGAPPIATLTWNDWVGEPVLGFPRTTKAAARQRA